jgi:hypothetical protein
MKKLFLGFVAILSIAFFSCNKDKANLISSEDEAIVSNDAAIEAVVESADYEVDLYSGSTESISIAGSLLKSSNDLPFGGRYHLGQAPNVTVEWTNGSYPVTITLNYGDGVELANGSVIKGSIVIVVSAAPRTNGAVRTVTFNNFYIDSINIAGTRTITFTTDLGNIPTCSIVGDITITFEDGTTIERNTEKTRAFIEGYNTPGDYSDDKFQITGFTNSVSSEGYTFSATIVEPLIRLGTCRYIVQGVVSLSKNDGVFAELNYGDGTCDDIATITKNGETRQITLGKRHRIRNN